MVYRGDTGKAIFEKYEFQVGLFSVTVIYSSNKIPFNLKFLESFIFSIYYQEK